MYTYRYDDGLPGFGLRPLAMLELRASSSIRAFLARGVRIRRHAQVEMLSLLAFLVQQYKILTYADVC
jgi:hypothetical protein